MAVAFCPGYFAVIPFAESNEYLVPNRIVSLDVEVIKHNVSVLGIYQTTVARRVEVFGIGFHSAQPCRMAICPAPANTGIVFERTDLDHFRIPARTTYVGHVAYSTGLIRNDVIVRTVEHLMSALFGCHVDNAIIEIDAVEVPIIDGSAQRFVEMIQAAGLVELDAPRHFIRIRKPISVSVADREVTLAPSKR